MYCGLKPKQTSLKNILIDTISFLYYEESLVSSNLNSKIFQIHCVRPNDSHFHECFDLIFGENLVFGPAVRTAPQRGTLFETCRTNATCFVARADDLFADFCCLVFGVRWCFASLRLVWEFSGPKFWV